MARVVKKIWNYYRQVAAIRGLLQWLGCWKYAIAWGTLVISAVTTLYLRVADSWSPGALILFFVALACLFLLCATLIAVLIRISKGEKSRAPSGSEKVDIDEINFAYLPDSPLKNGWAVAYRDNPVVPNFAPVSKFPGGLSVEVSGKYAFEHEVQPVTAHATSLTFSARFAMDTVFYTEVEMVKSGRGDMRMKKGWLAHVIGQTDPTQLTDTEWTVPIFGDKLGDGWMAFDLNLPDEVLRTFGRDHWRFTMVSRIRLRGSLAISPIRFHF